MSKKKEKDIAIADLVKCRFEDIYPEDRSNIGLAKSKWSLAKNRYQDYNLPTHCFGFYDWFCRDSALNARARRLYGILRKIGRHTTKFDTKKCYAFFKNNCPCYGDGKCYDDIRICDIDTGKVIFNICPCDPYGRTMLWGESIGWEDGICFDGGIKELEKWFATK